MQQVLDKEAIPNDRRLYLESIWLMGWGEGNLLDLQSKSRAPLLATLLPSLTDHDLLPQTLASGDASHN